MDLDPKDDPVRIEKPLVGIVGPCGAGKTTLVEGLNNLGYLTRHIAQEHSYVKDMWQRLTKPDLLVFLDASWITTCKRRKLDWTEAEWQVQQDRLSHARAHADLILETDELSIEGVLARVVNFIEERKT